MRLLALFLLPGILGFHLPPEKCRKHTYENTTEQRLKRHILTNYNSNEAPPYVTSSRPLRVKAQFAIKQFSYSAEKEIFSISQMTLFSWLDCRLKWDPTEFEGKENIMFLSFRIWAPNIRVTNSIEDYDLRRSFTDCEVKFTGRVKCKIYLLLEVPCAGNLDERPNDVQECQIEIGPYTEDAPLNITSTDRPLYMITAGNGGSWAMVGFKEEKSQDPKKHIIMKFQLERHSGVILCTFVAPSVILSVLTLSSLFLNGRKTRLGLSCFSLMCHLYLLSEIPFEVSKVSKKVPKALLFFRGSVIITITSIIISFVVNCVSLISRTCPDWVDKINESVIFSKLEFVLPQWQIIDTENSASAKWSKFANVLNFVWINISVIAYVGLLCLLIPQSHVYYEDSLSVLWI